jgi:hypothetical protein
MARGYTIFVIRGDLPRVPLDTSALGMIHFGSQFEDLHLLVSDKNWKKVQKKSTVSGGAARSVGSTSSYDQELQAALERSEFEAAIQMSMNNRSASAPIPQEEDEELAAALLLSQQKVLIILIFIDLIFAVIHLLFVNMY